MAPLDLYQAHLLSEKMRHLTHNSFCVARSFEQRPEGRAAQTSTSWREHPSVPLDCLDSGDGDGGGGPLRVCATCEAL